jgi:hypothetical protein
MRRVDPEAYIELEYGRAPGAARVIRVRVVRDEAHRYYRYEDGDGHRLSGSQIENALLAHDLADLRVHDGIHATGPCRFSFRGFWIIGRYV